MNTKARGGDDCYNRALPDEPVFTLLARDPVAPGLVRMWAGFRRTQIAEGTRPWSDLSQVEAAERTADEMVQWRIDADESWRNQPQLPLPPVSDGKTVDRFDG